LIETLIAIAVCAFSVFFIFFIWKYQGPISLKVPMASITLSLAIFTWTYFYSWEFSVVYALCFIAIISWTVIFLKRRTPLLKDKKRPYLKSNFSIYVFFKTITLSFLSVLFAGSASACIALSLPMYSDFELGNSLVSGLFLFLLIWPFSIVWVLSRANLVKLTVVSSVFAILSVSSVYLGTV
jgi:hypothetical protein